MKTIILIAIILTFPALVLAENPEREASRVCSEYVRIKKVCYYKAAKGILPFNGMRGIKSKIPRELIEISCNEGYEAFRKAGKQNSSVINQAMQISYSQCVNGYVTKSACSSAISAIKHAKTEMEIYYADHESYPNSIPNLGSIISNGVELNMTGGGKRYRITGTHQKCNTTYGTSNDVVGVVPASEVPEIIKQ